MKKLCIAVYLVTIVLFSATGETDMESYFLLDDFSADRSAIGTEWKGFTDQVMGGVSDMIITRIPEADRTFVRMQGEVSLENNGGFIQIRLMLKSFLKPFNGSAYKGIRVKVRGKGSGYYIFLRTCSMILPWKYLAASVSVTDEWQEVDIPWSAFKQGDYGRVGKLRTNRLKSLALVAYGEEFEAMIDLAEIGLYR